MYSDVGTVVETHVFVADSRARNVKIGSVDVSYIFEFSKNGVTTFLFEFLV